MRAASFAVPLLAAVAAGDRAGAVQPHLTFLLVDDYGWGNAGWHNTEAKSGGRLEVETPHMEALIKEGIELNRHYVFKFCSPTRSAIQSGRNPIHVNVQNVSPLYVNPDDPVAGFSAIARNMTGMAEHLRDAGYATAAVGKWDAGMATADHTPKGRGYQQSLIYFHHANDYWAYTAGNCAAASLRAGSAACPARFEIHNNTGACMDSAHVIVHKKNMTQESCCGLCDSSPGCVGWTFQYSTAAQTCFVCNATKGKPVDGRISGCVGAACAALKPPLPAVDLWSGDGPAHALHARGTANGTCHVAQGEPWSNDDGACMYEDALFEEEVTRVVTAHDPAERPLFLFWAPHIVHGPAQVAQVDFDAMGFITNASGPKAKARQNYLARVRYIDAAFGRLVDLYKSKGMWDDMLLAMSSDNGGPIGDANNWPLRGGKHSNWDGGVRVNAFVSGGFLPAKVRGTRLDALVTAWDWYATFASLAGADPTDHRAAAAGLPPVDGIDQWPVLSGAGPPPRTEVPLGSCTAADAGTDVFCQASGHATTIVAGLVSNSSGGLWKLLVGNVQLGGWQGPQFPNGSGTHFPVVSCGVPPDAGDGCLFDLVADPTEHVNLAALPAHRQLRDGLLASLRAHNGTAFSPNRGESRSADACAKAAGDYGTGTHAFYGPWVA